MKKILLLLLLGLNTHLYATKIVSHNITMVVEQSGQLSITENTKYNFGSSGEYGIYRDIPSQMAYGNFYKDNHLEIISVSMDNKEIEWGFFDIALANKKFVRIEIGNPNRRLIGSHDFQISYRVKKGVTVGLLDKSVDAIRWDIIDGFDTKFISNITADIYFPLSLSTYSVNEAIFNEERKDMSASLDNKWVSSRHFKVTIPHRASHKSIKVELTYPIGTLDQTGVQNAKMSLLDLVQHYIYVILFTFYFVYFFLEYRKYVKKENKHPSPRYTPPKKLSFLESGLILNSFANNKDLTSAILELGYLGYLSIEYQGKGSTIVLNKIDKLQREALTTDQTYLLDNVIFKNNKRRFILNKKDDEMVKTLKEDMQKLNTLLYTSAVKEDYFEENIDKRRKSFVKKSSLVLLPLIVFMAFEHSLFILSLFVMTIFLAIFLYGQKLEFNQVLTIKNLLYSLVGVVVAEVQLKMFGYSLFGGYNYQEILSFLQGSVGAFLVLLIFIFYIYLKMGSLSTKGRAIKEHLLGLKKFIKITKDKEIEKRVKIDALYLERLLPYALLFDETKRWVAFYKKVDVPTPIWYVGDIKSIEHLSSDFDGVTMKDESKN